VWLWLSVAVSCRVWVGALHCMYFVCIPASVWAPGADLLQCREHRRSGLARLCSAPAVVKPVPAVAFRGFDF
jgi:hypothetical protein